MARFSVALSMDEVYSCRAIARERGDKNPKAAIAEQAVAMGLRRKWDGEFFRVPDWDCWKKLNLTVAGIRVLEVQAMLCDLELSREDPDDHVYVLLSGLEAPLFTFLGWALGRDVKQEKFWRPTSDRFVYPHAMLRHAGDLRKRPKNSKKRLHQNDPADDFAGHGPWPYMLDSDGGRHPKYYGNIITSKWALPCRRCQTIIPVGMAVGGNMRTGTIHGDPKDCGFKIKAEVDPTSPLTRPASE